MALSKPLDEVTVTNMSFSLINEERVIQIDPATSDAEQLAKLWFAQIRRECFESHTWNFAKKRIALTPDTLNPPQSQYTHAYKLPNDFIRYIGRVDELGQIITSSSFVSEPHQRDYDIEGFHYLFNGQDNTSINIRYIYDNANINQWSPKFVRYVASELAIAIAATFTPGKSLMDRLDSKRDKAFQEAASINGQQVPPIRVQTSKWAAARTAHRTGVASRFVRFNG